MTISKRKKTILIIDFDIQLGDLLNIWLTKAGLRVFQTLSGPVGLLMARKLRPSLILLETKTPGLDGASLFIRRLKNDPKTKNIRIVFFTDTDYFSKDQQNKKEAEELGIVDFIKKEDCLNKFDRVIEKIKDLAK